MSKYGAKRTEVDGIVFASMAEARRYGELKLLERAGKIKDLELQPVYALIVNGVRVGNYIGDFRYVEGETVVLEDVKGVKTPVYQLKKKLVEAIYKFKITEVET